MCSPTLLRPATHAWVLFVTLGLACLGACQDAPVAAPSAVPAEPAVPKPASLTVYAATSLREAFTAITGHFEAEHLGTKVALSFAGSQDLRTQIEHGAHGDVFAAADLPPMAALEKAGLVRDSVVFARNELVVVLSKEAREKIRTLAQLPQAERLVIGVPEVPIGRYTLQALERANALYGNDFRDRVLAKVVSHELNVKQVLAKVTLGEADAAFVYRTDAKALAPKDRVLITTIDLPPEVQVVAEYRIAVVTASKHADLARAFIATCRSSLGRETLRAHGFLE
jgi:molybdate transport system substrate-binding protein